MAGKPANSLSVPSEKWTDKLRALAEAAAGEFPGGSIGIAAFQQLVVPGIQKRQQAWQESVAEKINELDARGEVDIDKLQDDPAFLDVLATATRVAMTTSNAAKREALRAAIANVATGDAPDESTRMMFLHYVEILTESHIQILKFFDNPPGWFTTAKLHQPQFHLTSNLEHVLTLAMPVLKGRTAFYEQIVMELDTYGLAKVKILRTSMSGDGWKESRSTPWGKQFLRFIDTE